MATKGMNKPCAFKISHLLPSDKYKIPAFVTHILNGSKLRHIWTVIHDRGLKAAEQGFRRKIIFFIFIEPLQKVLNKYTLMGYPIFSRKLLG